MKICAANFVAAIFASLLFSANALAAAEDAASESTEQPVEHCLTSPRDYTPPGTRWRYRLERNTGRRCWFLKDEVEKPAGKAAGQTAGQSIAAAEEPAPPRKRSAAARTLSDAHAELSPTLLERETRPARAQSPGRRNELAGSEVALAQTSPVANPPAPAAVLAEQSAEARTPPAATPAKPQVMPRAVPPLPVSEKPISLPMLITIIAGGLSVLGVLASLLLAWLASRRARRSPAAPMPPLELSDAPRRPGDLYRARKQLSARRSGRRAA